ncbi:ribosomal subunit interface protein [Candidatus Parcubacteria bacterium 4484_255]|nr:MAG: ribosomal subunit interface protein [Candidatus Parcubacteria bacterium 4484_255]
MEIKYFVQNFTLSDKDKDFLEDKIKKLTHFSNEIWEAKIDLSYNPSHYKNQLFRVEVNLRMPNKILRAVSRASHFEAAVIDAERVLQRQLRRYKGFRFIRRRLAQKFLRRKK